MKSTIIGSIILACLLVVIGMTLKGSTHAHAARQSSGDVQGTVAYDKSAPVTINGSSCQQISTDYRCGVTVTFLDAESNGIGIHSTLTYPDGAQDVIYYTGDKTITREGLAVDGYFWKSQQVQMGKSVIYRRDKNGAVTPIVSMVTTLDFVARRDGTYWTTLPNLNTFQGFRLTVSQGKNAWKYKWLN